MSNPSSRRNETVIREYEYKSPLWAIFPPLFMFGWTTSLGFHEALHNTNGLIIKRRSAIIAELSPEQATVFYWGVGFLGLFIVLLCLDLAAIRFTQKHSIIITTNGIIMPASLFFPRIVRIPFADIIDLEMTNSRGLRTLIILLPYKKYRIPAGCVPGKGKFDEIVLLVSEAIGSR